MVAPQMHETPWRVCEAEKIHPTPTRSLPWTSDHPTFANFNFTSLLSVSWWCTITAYKRIATLQGYDREAEIFSLFFFFTLTWITMKFDPRIVIVSGITPQIMNTAEKGFRLHPVFSTNTLKKLEWSRLRDRSQLVEKWTAWGLLIRTWGQMPHLNQKRELHIKFIRLLLYTSMFLIIKRC